MTKNSHPKQLRGGSGLFKLTHPGHSPLLRKVKAGTQESIWTEIMEEDGLLTCLWQDGLSNAYLTPLNTPGPPAHIWALLHQLTIRKPPPTDTPTGFSGLDSSSTETHFSGNCRLCQADSESKLGEEPGETPGL